jgi:hypothetical protein
MKSRPVLIVFSILAALQVLSGASALADIIGKDTFALFALLVAAVQVGMTFYVQNQVVPTVDIGAYINSDGQLVAGPAAGVTNGKTVDVIKTEPPASEGAGGYTSTVVPPSEQGESPVVLAVALVALVIVIVLLVRIL